MGPSAGCLREPENDLDSSRQTLRKGQGGVLGDSDYCDDPANPCTAVPAEGDCDTNAQCVGTGQVVCGQNNGARFGFVPTLDLCWPATCQNARLDPLETSIDCGGPCGLCASDGGVMADSGVADSGIADSGVADSGVVDSGAADSGAADSGAADSGVVDSGAADSGVADSGVADSGAAPDAGVGDAGAGEIRMAITIDDLTRNGPEVPGRTRTQLARDMLAVLARHGVPQVYGFVNGARPTTIASDRAVLDAWLSAGHPLGNHTYSHADARALDVASFTADIERNEPVLSAAMGPNTEALWKTFRFTYSAEGHDLASRAEIRAWLADHQYRIAHLTVDFFDWSFATPYVRCLRAQDLAAQAELERRYMLALERAFDWSTNTSQVLFGRQIAHILLMHIAGVSVAFMDQVLTWLESRGVRFISLDEALADPLYTTGIPSPVTWGGSFLQQAKATRPRLVLPSSPAMISTSDLCP